jgi:tRNA nucleotidyltransferase/poly(A) polymerase
MVDEAREALAGEEAWVVGGALRDELLGRPVLDLDIACREPKPGARRFARRVRGAPFRLSDRHGAWRVALDGGRTVDFTPVRDGIEHDLATRDFTINAIARPLAGGDAVDPFGGRRDLEAGLIRAVSPGIFTTDPLRLLRAVRLEDELGFRIEPGTEALVREHAGLVSEPSGERILAELARLSVDGYRRLAGLGLLERLGGSLEREEYAAAVDTPRYRLVSFLGEAALRLPVSNELRRYARALLRAPLPDDDSPRAIHRFRRTTEPWALDALAFAGAPARLADAVRAARERDPAEPLVRGDELEVEPGPLRGKLLELIAEERAAGTISTREEALELVRRIAR